MWPLMMNIGLALLIALPLSAQNLLRAPESVVYDSAHHRYLASNYNTGHIVAIDSSGQQSYFVQNQYCRNGLCIVGNIVYAACIDSGVKGFDLETGELVMHTLIPGSINLNDITLDDSGNLFVSDVYGSALYKIRLSDGSASLYMQCHEAMPNGLYYDAARNRILCACYTAATACIREVNLNDSTVSDIINTGFNYLDGVTVDNAGNVYFSTWETRSVYRYDSAFSVQPQLVYHNSGGPADIFFNRETNVLAIPVMGINDVVFLPMESSALTEPQAVPTAAALLENYPNPFNPTTTIALTLDHASSVSLQVFDVSGRLVETLADGRFTPGRHEFAFNGSTLPSGTYFAHVRSEGLLRTQRLVLLK
jgi:hypothetical protein